MSSSTKTPPSSKPSARRRSARWLAVFLAIIAIALGIWWYQKHLVPKRFDVVEPGLIYRSGQSSSWVIEDVLKTNHIQKVLAFADDPDDPDLSAEIAICRNLGIERHLIPMSGDGVAPPEAYVDAIAYLLATKAKSQPLLIHCSAGTERTGAVIALYQLLVLNGNPATITHDLIAHGHNPSRNPKLIPHLNQLMPQIADGLAAKGLIPKAPDPIPSLVPSE